MDIEKQAGYRSYGDQWALNFRGNVMVVIPTACAKVVLPEDASPGTFTNQFFGGVVEEAPTTAGALY